MLVDRSSKIIAPVDGRTINEHADVARANTARTQCMPHPTASSSERFHARCLPPHRSVRESTGRRTTDDRGCGANH
jgi:hypothetical protein